ncbi:hypothetical protein GPJ56_005489 [Histomonas meleagridis]|uniref:uncharacterized protein n=1 Tax=Histomonas meleagridis TaxID=135588 RepID=UPI00355A5B95|nr:hypothetical protein GPJ56_005489 [Histomonas meleagridis]KAH0802513.1 hypothetical protein GO595_004562 [Histomonas meleagridis]
MNANNYPVELLIKSNHKGLHLSPVSKISSPNVKQYPQVISRNLFKDSSVYVSIEDEEEKQTVRDSLTKAGAKIVDNVPDFADYIISTKRMPIRQSPARNSVGTRNLKSIFQRIPQQRNILLEQIPWATTKSITTDLAIPINLTDDEESSSDDSSNLQIVVADTKGRLRPIHSAFKQLPKLHLGPVPQDYTFSPFDPIPENPTQFIQECKKAATEQPRVIKFGPPDHNYCYICKKHFDNASQHHASQMHQMHHNALDWSKFNEVSSSINSRHEILFK